MPLQLIRNDLGIDFLRQWKWAAIFSTVVLGGGLVALFPTGGFRYGIDFLGGTQVQVQFKESHDLSEIRETLDQANLGKFELQAFGEKDANEILVTLEAREEQAALKGQSSGDQVTNALKSKYPDLVVRRIETVGPKVGKELKLAAFGAIAFSVVAIMVYIWFRFQWRYGIAALIATAHDVWFVMAMFVFNQHEITLPVIAAVLTLAGYSINDTIVILDRIRDNLRRSGKATLWDVINASLNQTLSRTLLTSGLTLLTVISLYFFGGEILRDFSFALLVGILVGTYSSIFVASPLLILLNHWFPPRAR